MVRLIFFALFIYLVYSLLMNFVVKPFREGYDGNNSKKYRSPFGQKEGDVTISYNPQKDRKEHAKVGEYVEYEEVKD